MEIKLPIKYAIEPIYPYANSSGGILGYIVTKCYVVEKKTTFSMDGNIKETYSIVYPYKGLETFKMMKNKRIPEFNNFGYYRNLDYVDQVYTTLFSSVYPCYQVDDMIKQFSDFEFKVMEKCKDMEVTENDNVSVRCRGL